MDNTATNNQAAPLVEEGAALTATHLLMDAIADVPYFVPPRVDNPTEAILIGFHALIAKLDSMETSQLEALRDLRESLDFLAARPDVNEASESPTEFERVVIYRALEADYMKSGHPLTSINQMDAALLRFKKLAGL